jgi:hypothetical protein
MKRGGGPDPDALVASGRYKWAGERELMYVGGAPVFVDEVDPVPPAASPPPDATAKEPRRGKDKPGDVFLRLGLALAPLKDSIETEFLEHILIRLQQSDPPPFRSKTERRLWDRLSVRDDVVKALYEPFSLRIGPGAVYTTDIVLLTTSPEWPIECHECKGAYMREAGRVRFLSAVDRYPCFRWYLDRWIKGEWVVEEMGQK